MLRVALLACASLLAASLPRVSAAAGAQHERSPAERAAGDAQRDFERSRRLQLPRVAARGGGCDVTIGRFCYWDDNSDSPLPVERPKVVRARARLRAALDSLGALDPTSDHIAGQRVRYALDAGEPLSATEFLDDCAATVWWCQALRGLAWHRAGKESRSAAAFDSAIAAMPDTLRCAWLDIEAWLPPGTHLSASDHPDCAEQERLSARVFWLAAPLLSWHPSAARDEFLSRRTLITIIAGTVTPQHLSWGSDQVELTLRFAWPTSWAREDEPVGMLPAPEIRVVGHGPAPSFSVVPNRHALERPFEAAPGDWKLSGDRTPPMRYAPGWLAMIDTLPVQLARFVRADGDSMVVVAVYDARESLGDSAVGRSEWGDSARGDSGSAVRAAALLAVAPDSTLAIGRRAGAPSGAITIESASRSALAAVEVVDSARSRAARWRGAVAPLPRSALVSDLLVGMAGAGVPPMLLDSAARHAIAALRVSAGDTIALYWESYARATPDDPAHVALRVVPLSAGVFTRIARWFGLARAEPPIALEWDDSGGAVARLGRSLRVAIPDMPEGRYRIELVVESGGERGTAAREIVVR